MHIIKQRGAFTHTCVYIYEEKGRVSRGVGYATAVSLWGYCRLLPRRSLAYPTAQPLILIPCIPQARLLRRCGGSKLRTERQKYEGPTTIPDHNDYIMYPYRHASHSKLFSVFRRPANALIHPIKFNSTSRPSILPGGLTRKANDATARV